MVIFNSYVKLPEGKEIVPISQKPHDFRILIFSVGTFRAMFEGHWGPGPWYSWVFIHFRLGEPYQLSRSHMNLKNYNK